MEVARVSFWPLFSPAFYFSFSNLKQRKKKRKKRKKKLPWPRAVCLLMGQRVVAVCVCGRPPAEKAVEGGERTRRRVERDE
ncbi:hypothetical protein TRSC58_07589 [Trypanosoma rangeli SC58]|uniref:Uncharacterized protein n=1 Tax=Trypanosoma rangeli SC58 TaxID=429131 RepID=A0A061ISV9_TRYRA|nr:hypothetical protein TRSC58_07589 [Trypanosoma rangeli SC58]